jgi:KDO2-lipid IV(A) lauroyltransferase
MKHTETQGSMALRARIALFALHCVGRLPVGLLRALAWPLGTLCWLLPIQLRKVSELNLRLCFPETAAAVRRSWVRRSLLASSKSALETPAIWLGSQARLDSLRGGISGEEVLDEARARGHGVVLLSPHLGNWEYLNCVLPRMGPVHCLYRVPRMVALDGALRGFRERSGIRMVAATSTGMRPLLRALRANEMVLMLPDQEPGKGHGVHAPFFGVPALTMTLVARILRRTGATPLYVLAERRPSGRFRIHFRAAPPGLADPDPQRAAAALNAGLEACVRLLPEQYLWAYKRFKTAPSGEPTPYRAIWSKRRQRKHPFRPA